MPIKLTYKDINNTVFAEALNKLAKHDSWKDAKIAYNVAKIIRRYREEMEIARELYSKLAKQHASLDEKGNPKFTDAGTLDVKEENKKGFEEACKNFDTVSFEIDCHMMPMEKVDQVGLNALELSALEPMLIPVDLSSGL